MGTILGAENILSFLRQHSTAFLGTLGKDNQPHGSSVYYIVNDDLTFYFATKNETFKYKNLSQNKKVALVITDDTQLKTVQIEGVATELSDSDEVSTVLESIALDQHDKKLTQSAPLNKIVKGYHRFFKVKPTWVRCIFYDNGDNLVEYEEMNI